VQSHGPPDAPSTMTLCGGMKTGRRNNWLKMSMPEYDMSRRTNESVRYHIGKDHCIGEYLKRLGCWTG
jgi:hypothetical protein